MKLNSVEYEVRCVGIVGGEMRWGRNGIVKG